MSCYSCHPLLSDINVVSITGLYQTNLNMQTIASISRHFHIKEKIQNSRKNPLFRVSPVYQRRTIVHRDIDDDHVNVDMNITFLKAHCDDITFKIHVSSHDLFHLTKIQGPRLATNEIKQQSMI